MQTVMVLLVFLVLAAASGFTGAQVDHTYITNMSVVWSIRASTSYDYDVQGSTSHFQQRLITSGSTEGDQYWAFMGEVRVLLWVDGSPNTQEVEVRPDFSLVGYDNADWTGVDIFEAAYGTLTRPYGAAKTTIYPY